MPLVLLQLLQIPWDTSADRDFAIEFVGCLALMQNHLSRISEEMVLWSSQEFNFVMISDAFCTGSSIMPQKKNPDIPELIRGKERACGRSLDVIAYADEGAASYL